MDIKLVKSFEENKQVIRKEIRKQLVESQGYLDYLDLVKILFSNIEYIGEYGSHNINKFDTDKITVVDNGDYQGTLIFIIPLDCYQPCVTDHFYTNNYYGSCSGCDTMMAISMSYNYEDREESVDDLIGLCLNLIQSTKRMGE